MAVLGAAGYSTARVGEVNLEVLVVLDARGGYQMNKTITTGIAGQTKSLPLRPYLHLALVLLLDSDRCLFSIAQDREQARTQAEYERQAKSHVAATQKGIEPNLEVMPAAMNIQMDTNPGTQGDGWAI